MANVVLNSVHNAIALEKTMNKGSVSLISDFLKDIESDSIESVKKSLKEGLKKEGFIPSNCFVMKTLNTTIGLFSRGVTSENVSVIINFCRIKPSEGKVVTERKLSNSINKYGSLNALIKQAKDAQTPAAKKAAKTAAAKKGAQTRSLNKKGGTVVPQAVRNAAIAADSAKAEKPLEYQATPAMKIDRAVNAFLALTENERMAFVNAIRKELNTAVLAVSIAKKKVA